MVQRNILALTCAGGALLFGACKKDNQDAPDPAALLGTWQTTNVAADVNRNGQIDAGEQQILDSPRGFTLFFSDKFQGGRKILTSQNSDVFRWEWMNNFADLKMHFYFATGDTASWLVHIEKLTKTDLTFLDTSGDHRFYWEFRKL